VLILQWPIVNLMALKYEPGEVPLSGCEAELNNQQSPMYWKAAFANPAKGCESPRN
jgi:hypothetical protein